MNDINDVDTSAIRNDAALIAIKARAEECAEAGKYEAAAELYALLIAILEA